MKNKVLNMTFRGLLILLSVIFVFAGMDKVVCRPDMVNMFKELGIPKTIMVVVGFTELVFAVLIHIKYFTKLALQGLMFIMFFAFVLTIISNGFMSSIFPLMIFVILLFTNHVGQIVKDNEK